jgi:tetratricopeptide (TPR) repeat protein
VKAWILTGISTVLLISTSALPAVALPKPLPKTTATPIAQGNEFLQKGWVDAAIDAFKAALKADPNSIPAHLGLAQAYQKTGKLPEAWDAYQQVLALDSANVTALQAIGVMGEYRPEWQPAGITAITKLLEQSSQSTIAKTELLTQRALLLGFQGKFEQAWADYRQILGTEISVQTGLKAAQAAGFSGRSSEAIALYDRVLQQVPNNDEAQLNRAYFALQAKQISVESATQVLTVWLQQNPEAAPPELFNLVGELPADAQWQGLYDRLLAQVPNNLPVQRRALQLLAAKSPDTARAQLAQLMAANANQPLAYFVQAEVAKTLKDLNLAGQSYEALLQQQPDRADAIVALGGVRFEQKRYAEAENLLNRALVLMPNDWQVQRILADLYATQDQPYIALKLLRDVEKIQRQQGVRDPQVRDRIAQIEVENLKRRSFQPAWERY